MTQPSGATPPAVNPAATDREDAIAQDLLADAMSDAAEGADHLGDPGKKALDAMKAQRKAALDELKAAHAKLKEYEDRDKTEAQRTAERLAAAEQTAADATARLLRERPDPRPGQAARRHHTGGTGGRRGRTARLVPRHAGKAAYAEAGSVTRPEGARCAETTHVTTRSRSDGRGRLESARRVTADPLE